MPTAEDCESQREEVGPSADSSGGQGRSGEGDVAVDGSENLKNDREVWIEDAITNEVTNSRRGSRSFASEWSNCSAPDHQTGHGKSSRTRQ